MFLAASLGPPCNHRLPSPSNLVPSAGLLPPGAALPDVAQVLSILLFFFSAPRWFQDGFSRFQDGHYMAPRLIQGGPKYPKKNSSWPPAGSNMAKDDRMVALFRVDFGWQFRGAPLLPQDGSKMASEVSKTPPSLAPRELQDSPSWRQHGKVLSAFWRFILKQTWKSLGPSWVTFGLSWTQLGPILGHFRRHLCIHSPSFFGALKVPGCQQRSGHGLEPLGTILEPSWGHFGSS